MRWNELFDDLEAQAEALAVAERSGEVDGLARGELAAVALLDRVRAALGTQLRVRLTGGLQLVGELVRVGPDWLLLDEGNGREAIVPEAALLSLRGLGRFASAPGSAGVVAGRLGLRVAMRGVVRDRSACRLHLVDGSALDGTLDGVGADFVVLADHAIGEARRRREVRDVAAVPLSAVAALRRSV